MLCQRHTRLTKRKTVIWRHFPRASRDQLGVTAPEYVGIVSAMIALLIIAFPAFSEAIIALLNSVIEGLQNFLSSV